MKRGERRSFSLLVELFIRQATKFEFKISRRRTTLIHPGLGLSSWYMLACQPGRQIKLRPSAPNWQRQRRQRQRRWLSQMSWRLNGTWSMACLACQEWTPSARLPFPFPFQLFPFPVEDKINVRVSQWPKSQSRSVFLLVSPLTVLGQAITDLADTPSGRADEKVGLGDS